jgi:superfamily II RNA helicase
MSVSLADLLPDASRDPSPDVLLDRFLEYTAGKRLILYPAQEDAILELLHGKNVILNTPTGSGKSLVASAMLFASLARGQRMRPHVPHRRSSTRGGWGCAASSVRTGWPRPATRPSIATRPSSAAPPKSSPTSLREGADVGLADVVMDEFHYYADRDRGVAWQVPLLTMPQARFLLMSATLGDTRFFEDAITRLNGRATVTVKSGDRPVPLERLLRRSRWRT